MRTCPSTRQLEQLLDEELNDAQQAALVEHVGSCASCQTVLEHLTETAEELQSSFRCLGGERPASSGRQGVGWADEGGPPAAAWWASFVGPPYLDDAGRLPSSEAAFLAHLKQFPPSALSGAAANGASAEKPSGQEPPAVSGYEILGELGRGGMGVVYKARHLALDRVVALKMILAGTHAGPKDQARFRQEAAAVARLHHPNIVQVFDIGDADGRPYFALEYVEKGNLANYLHGECQPLPTILPLMETLARAMAYAHQCGIIHRDLKPANILLGTKEKDRSESGNSGLFMLDRSYVPKITDFGLAKRLDAEGMGAHSYEVLGTPSYMAPEQAEAKAREFSPGTDVYALGAILYEMLTGRPPFKGATSLDTLVQVLHEEPVPPSRLRPRLPRDVETICLKCLEKDPSRRYTSASALADDLRRCRRGDPIEARRVSVVERGWKWARRRPALAGLIAAIFLVTLLGLAGVTREWRVAVRERNEKELQRQQARNALYFSRIAQSRLQWWTNDLSGASRSLADCVPRHEDRHDYRGWEWYYLLALYRSELFAFNHPRSGPDGSVAYDSTGGRIASVVSFELEKESARSELRLWDAVRGDLVLERTLRFPFHRISFRPGGKHLALGSADGRIVLWDTTTHREVWQGSLADCRITGLAFSADGKTIASAAIDTASPTKGGAITLWDVESGKEKQLLLAAKGRGFHCLAFHPTRPLLACGGEDNTVRLWDLSSGKEGHPLRGHKTAVYGVAFSPDGNRLVSAAKNGTIKIWKLETSQKETEESSQLTIVQQQNLTGKTGAIRSLAFSPDGRSFAYCGTDKTVRVWDLESGTNSLTFRGHRGMVESVQYSPDGQRLLSSSPSQGEVKVWDLTRHPDYSNLVREAGDVDHPDRDLVDIAFHEDGQHLVSVTVAGELQSWDANSGVLHAQHSLAISAEPVDLGGILAAFEPGGRRLAARCREDRRLVRIWDVESGKELRTYRGHRLPIFCLFYSRDGRYLATCACDEKPKGKPFEIKVWDADTDEQLAEMGGGDGQILTVFFSPDSRLLAVGNDNHLRVFDWAAGREVVPPLTSHKSKISVIAFRPDGARVVTAAIDDPEIHIWDSRTWGSSTKVNQQPLRRLAAPTHMGDMAFSPDGKRLVGANRDFIKMWDIEAGVEVLTLRGAPQRYGEPPFNARIVFHPNGLRLAGANWDESISVWDAPMPLDEKSRLQQVAVRRQGADARALFWHLEEAEYCVEHNISYGAQFHLQRLRNALLPPLLEARLERLIVKMQKGHK